jgi:hypothetical protein
MLRPPPWDRVLIAVQSASPALGTWSWSIGLGCGGMWLGESLVRGELLVVVVHVAMPAPHHGQKARLVEHR